MIVLRKGTETRGSIISSIDLEFVTRPSFDRNLRLPAAFHDFHSVESDSFEAGYEKGELSLPPPRYRYTPSPSHRVSSQSFPNVSAFSIDDYLNEFEEDVSSIL